jgi:periplasmic divalent cation tolerance protein
VDEYIEVRTTVAERADAERLARVLVEQRVAACVQIDGPITSVYRWKAEVETAAEWRCTIKTRKSLYDAVERAIRALHRYETPEIIGVDVAAGASDYLQWISEATKT